MRFMSLSFTSMTWPLYSDNFIKTTVLCQYRSTKLVLPKWHKYVTLNRVIRVQTSKRNNVIQNHQTSVDI